MVLVHLRVFFFTHLSQQGIIDWTETETFAMEPKSAKLLRKQRLTPVRCHKKVHWFFSYVCNRKYCRVLGALLRDNV